MPRGFWLVWRGALAVPATVIVSRHTETKQSGIVLGGAADVKQALCTLARLHPKLLQQFWLSNESPDLPLDRRWIARRYEESRRA